VDSVRDLAHFLAGFPPSCNESAQWLRAASKRGKNFCSSDITGKWCIPATEAEVDKAWNRIQGLLKRGRLICAKVSTALGRRRSGHPHFVIIVYTRDWRDRDEVNRVREILRTAGFKTTLGYKRDIDTVVPNPEREFIYSDF
jgi:Domain of unknown function (DUF1917)